MIIIMVTTTMTILIMLFLEVTKNTREDHFDGLYNIYYYNIGAYKSVAL